MGFKKEDGRNGKDPWKVANIMATYNYGQFRFIEGNRPIDNHFMKIVKMIEAVGTLWCPVLVNERMEIVDGQHRFEAFKKLKLPVIYVVQNGIGMNEVRAMNNVAIIWKQRDFIHSYANGDERKQDYIYLENLMKMYPYFAQRTYQMAITGDVGGGYKTGKIKNGSFKCTVLEYENAMKILDWLSNFREYVEQIVGKKDYMYQALIYCYMDSEIDNDYLLEKYAKYYPSINETATITGAIQEIEDKIYNYYLRAPREPVSISGNYKRYIRGKRYRSIKKG